MVKRLLPLIPAGLTVVQVLPTPDTLTIVATSDASTAACPSCGRLSGRVHSTYQRRLQDLPWQGRAVVIRVHARRFRIASPSTTPSVRPAGLGDATAAAGAEAGARPGRA